MTKNSKKSSSVTVVKTQQPEEQGEEKRERKWKITAKKKSWWRRRRGWWRLLRKGKPYQKWTRMYQIKNKIYNNSVILVTTENEWLKQSHQKNPWLLNCWTQNNILRAKKIDLKYTFVDCRRRNTYDKWSSISFENHSFISITAGNAITTTITKK